MVQNLYLGRRHLHRWRRLSTAAAAAAQTNPKDMLVLNIIVFPVYDGLVWVGLGWERTLLLLLLLLLRLLLLLLLLLPLLLLVERLACIL